MAVTAAEKRYQSLEAEDLVMVRNFELILLRP